MCPCLAHCVARVFNLPALLESSLGLSLRVPQSCMLAAYPPGAHYQRHFDSYGGRDIPRYVTVLLYLGWRPRSGGELKVYPPIPSGTEGKTARPDGPTRLIEPQPGRLCVFFAQEVEHEVLPSAGERYALTLWIWSTEKDDKGR